MSCYGHNLLIFGVGVLFTFYVVIVDAQKLSYYAIDTVRSCFCPLVLLLMLTIDVAVIDTLKLACYSVVMVRSLDVLLFCDYDNIVLPFLCFDVVKLNSNAILRCFAVIC